MNWQTIVQKNELSVAIVNLSSIAHNLRIEAEFYTKSQRTGATLKGVDVIATSQYGTSKELNDKGSGFPVLRLNEFEQMFAGKPAKYCDLLEEKEFEALKLKKNDVLICRTNGNPKYVGKSAIVMEDVSYAFASYLFRIKTNEKISPATLVAYLNSSVGREEIEKYSIVSNQANFSPAKFREIAIPTFPKSIQDIIDDLINKSWSLKLLSDTRYKEAEKLLLNDIDLLGHTPSTMNTSTRNLSDCLIDDRFDAEYWQPKYDDIAETIKSYRNGFDTFDNLFIIGNQTTINPNETYLYIELADVNSSLGTIENYTELRGEELPSRGRMPLRQNDVIMSSLDGSLNKTALVTIDKQNIIGSTGFFVLRKKYFEPEVALVLLKSGPIQEIVGRQAQGTILTAIPKISLSRILLPKIASDTQAKIKSLVMDAHKNKELAQLTLEKAKRAVEIFVEQDEAQALAYLAS